MTRTSRPVPHGDRPWPALAPVSAIVFWAIAAAGWARATDASPGAPPRDASPVVEDAVTSVRRLAPPPPPPALTPLVVPVIANRKELGDIEVQVDARGNGVVDSTRLLALLDGILTPRDLARLRQAAGDTPQIAIASLTIPGVKVAFDPAALELHVDIALDDLNVDHITLAGRGAPDLKAVQPPARLGSAVTISADKPYEKQDGRTLDLPMFVNVDGFVTAGGFPGTTFRFGGTWTDLGSGPKWQRSQTRLTRDFFDSAIRLDAGEFNLPITGLQGAGALLGLSVARNYDDIRPFQNIHPSGRSALTLDRDSTIIVLVNGLESRRLHLAPGRYEFSDFGVPYGASNVKLLVEDLAGRREVTSLSLFNSVNLLQRGITDFGFSAGLRPGLSEGSYGGPVLVSGYWTKGFTDRLTAGIGGQAAGHNWLVSAQVATGTHFGIVGLTAAMSRYDGRSGSAAALDYRVESAISRRSSIVTTLSAETRTGHFASPYVLVGSEVEERWRVDGRVELRQPVLTLSLGAHAAEFRHLPRQQSVELSATRSWSRLSATVNLGMERAPDRRLGGYISFGISMPLGQRSSVDARYDTHDNHMRTVELSRFREDHIDDFDGRIAVQEDSHGKEIAGEVNYLNNRFEAHAEQNVDYRQSGSDSRQSHLRISTAVTFADGSFAIGRPSSHGFMILPLHSSLTGSKVVVRDEADRVQARNGLLGPAVVPLESSYTERTYSYDVDGLPDGYNLVDTSPRVFPSQASPYRVRIGSSHWKMALGYLLDNGAPIAEHTAVVTSETDKSFEPQTIFTNSAGRFVIDGLAAGSYTLRFEGRAVKRITIPNDRNGLVNVGKIDISSYGH